MLAVMNAVFTVDLSSHWEHPTVFRQCWNCDSTFLQSVLSIVSIRLVLTRDSLTEPMLDVRDYLLYILQMQGVHDLDPHLHYIHHL